MGIPIPALCGMRRGRHRLFFILLLAGLSVCSCGTDPSFIATETGQAETESGQAYEKTTVQDERSAYWEAEHGILTASENQTLSKGAGEVILSYMERCYQAAADFNRMEIGDLFTEDAGANAALNQIAWEYLIGIRSMQRSNLRLADYHYKLTVEAHAEGRKNGLTVRATEDSIQHFAQHPEVASELFKISHVFILERQEDVWKIKGHLQGDGIYQNILGKYWDEDIESFLLRQENGEMPDDTESFQNRKEELLKAAREQKSFREQRNGEPVDLPSVQHSYNRDAATAYAEQWVGRRNDVWDDFTGYGGNCQNFVSQCLYAGGIPRDISGMERWSWKKSGTPEAALPDAPYYTGEAGDVIQMGLGER
ncbi:MAG: amidase domain-containing protein [Clostridium sp.]|nr:amidase domain-containing protein [Clostridium sp.]